MGEILTHEETLDASYLPPKMPGRETELQTLITRYRDSLGKGLPYHLLLTGGIGSGKTALGLKLAEELRRLGRLKGLSVQTTYVNCWRRSNDRSILLDLVRSVGAFVPDRGYSHSEMLDIFDQGMRKNPGHRFIVLDEVSGLVRHGTKLVYLLTRAREISLGAVSLFLIAPEDVLPYLDAASRSSFGLTHRLPLEPYDRPALERILDARAQLALRPGSYPPEVLESLARAAAPRGDARFALELLLNAARVAEEQGATEIGPEHARAARGSLVPTESEHRLEELPVGSLYVLLASARSLRGPKSTASTERVRRTYQALAEERGTKPMSRVTFWRTVKSLERDGYLDVQPAAVGRPAQLRLDDVPVSRLELLLEERLADGPRKPVNPRSPLRPS
ncbi:MAG TPA: AAA family ATPase [Thermoplasmata archaeon]|nr:AAA family ATPase [Thermoplasmata archaeon]